jgi:DNA-binding response OmpR family regulator
VFENQPVDGIELCEAIRQNGSDVPIILITAVMKETEKVLRGFEAGADEVLAVYIHRLREKLEPDPDHLRYIETIKGLGYRFNGRPTRAVSPLARPRTGCCRSD